MRNPKVISLDDMIMPGKTALETFKSELDKCLMTLPDNSETQCNSLLNLEGVKQSYILYRREAQDYIIGPPNVVTISKPSPKGKLDR